MAGTRKKTATKKRVEPAGYRLARTDDGWVFVTVDATGGEIARSDAYTSRGAANGFARMEHPGLRRV